MSVSFGANLFGLESASVNWASEAKPDYETESGEFEIHAAFGTNGMTFAMNEEAETITFKLFVALEGKDQRKRSDVMGRQIDLGSMEVYTTPFGIGVMYECTYSTMVEVDSKTMEVTTIESFGSNVGFGDFANSFDMLLLGAGGDEGRFVMGAPLTVNVNWSVKTLPDLTFFFLNCGVEHGEVTANIVKDGCYAGIVDAKPVEATGTSAAFRYNVFKGQGEDSTAQDITCSIKICRVGKCDMPKSDSDCSNEDGDSVYIYAAHAL